MKITKRSALTGIEHTMDLDVTEEQVKRWRSGELIQNAMPNLTVDEREFMMSGVTKEEWEIVFGSGEDL